MFQFLLAEVTCAQGHRVFPCALCSHLLSKGKDGVPQKSQSEIFFFYLVAQLRSCDWVGYPFHCHHLLTLFAYG